MPEPIPFVRNGVLYWKVAVVPEDSAGIAYQAFVDSRTNRVVELRYDEEIRLFLAGRLDDLPDESDQNSLFVAIREKLNELEQLVDELERRESTPNPEQ